MTRHAIPVPVWTPNASYPHGIIVRWNGLYLRCKSGHTALDWSDPWTGLKRGNLASRWIVDTALLRHEAGSCDESCPVIGCRRHQDGAAA